MNYVTKLQNNSPQLAAQRLFELRQRFAGLCLNTSTVLKKRSLNENESWNSWVGIFHDTQLCSEWHDYMDKSKTKLEKVGDNLEDETNILIDSYW